MGPNPKQNQEISDLVQKAIAGNDTAFGQIYDLYYERVYRFIFYRVSHREIAEDLVAETFIRIWNKVSEIQEIGAFQGWMFQIARNLVIDHYRTRKADTDISTLENVLEYDDNVIEKTNLGFQQKEFLAALERLSDEQRLIIKLKFFDDLDNKEISQVLDKSEGAIRVIQHRAINELKHLIQKHDE